MCHGSPLALEVSSVVIRGTNHTKPLHSTSNTHLCTFARRRDGPTPPHPVPSHGRSGVVLHHHYSYRLHDRSLDDKDTDRRRCHAPRAVLLTTEPSRGNQGRGSYDTSHCASPHLAIAIRLTTLQPLHGCALLCLMMREVVRVGVGMGVGSWELAH